jgi:coenzyme F420 hydrogenase subunit beta
MKKYKRVDEVVKWRLCLGCGACAYACPENNIKLIDVPDYGIRPQTDLTKCRFCGECIKVCPGIEISQQPVGNKAISELINSWGPVLEVWEGYAADPEIRFEGSSGGAATALALFCLEKENFASVLHIGAEPEAPLRNIPVFSKSREDLLKRTGSRYSPAAPCEKLNWIEESESPCAFIGKPCDVAALRKSQAVNIRLNEKVGLAISIFCAGTPSSAGTYHLLNVLGVKPEQVEEFRYRGRGWPGPTAVKIRDTKGEILQMSYEKSWGNILSNYSQFRCRLCPDSTGELADIACGDPWYRDIAPSDPGWSLILVRTEKGREILQKAICSGYLIAVKASADILPQSQKAILGRRRHLFGRLLTMRMMGVPIPCYKGFYLFRNWRELSSVEKFRSIGGTLKRIILRGWIRPLRLIALNGSARPIDKSEKSPIKMEEIKTK